MQAITRHGEVLEKGDKVRLIDSPSPKYNSIANDELEIEEIVPWHACESKFMIRVKHIATGNPFKRLLDTNWFTKIG